MLRIQKLIWRMRGVPEEPYIPMPYVRHSIYKGLPLSNNSPLYGVPLYRQTLYRDTPTSEEAYMGVLLYRDSTIQACPHIGNSL